MVVKQFRIYGQENIKKAGYLQEFKNKIKFWTRLSVQTM